METINEFIERFWQKHFSSSEAITTDTVAVYFCFIRLCFDMTGNLVTDYIDLSDGEILETVNITTEQLNNSKKQLQDMGVVVVVSKGDGISRYELLPPDSKN